MPSILILVLQIASGIGIYLTMCIIFKLESYNYLIDTLRNRRINNPKHQNENNRHSLHSLLRLKR